MGVPLLRRLMLNVPERKFKTYETGVFSAPSGVSPGGDFVFASFFYNAANTNFIAQGTAVDQRIGNKIYLHAIKTKWMIASGIIPTAGVMVRMGTYHNATADGSNVDAGDVFYNKNALHSQRNLAKMARTKVTLKNDRMYSFVVTGTNGASVVASGPPRCFDLNIYPKKVITVDGTANTIADLAKDDYGWWIKADGINVVYSVSVQLIYGDA